MWHVARMEVLQLGTNRYNSFRQTTFVCIHCVQWYHQSLLKNQDNVLIPPSPPQHIWRERFHELEGLYERNCVVRWILQLYFIGKSEWFFGRITALPYCS